MNNGWIKLHRKVLDNEIFRHDRTAWHVFEVLLLIANKETGKWSGGRKQLAELAGVNENTLYNALKRLESQQMVNRFVNSRYSVYSICNWGDYQQSGQQVHQQLINSSSTARQHSNKNKNKNILTKVNISNELIPEHLIEIMTDFEAHRKAIKKPMSEKAKSLIVKKLEKLYPEDYEKQVMTLEQSIVNGWAGIFDIREMQSTKIKEFGS